VHVEGLLNFLEAIRLARRRPISSIAASCLVFGESSAGTQDESTPLAPVCVYGITKATGIYCCRLYRNGAGVRASVGILYKPRNHRCGGRTSSRKRSSAPPSNIRLGRASKLVLGDLSR